MPVEPASPPTLRGPRLVVDLDAVAANYRALARIAAPAAVAPVVKADAYGLGARPVSLRLWAEGARDFFIASVHEGIALRQWLPEAQIFVLNGFLPGEETLILGARLTPVLNTLSMIEAWRAAAGGAAAALQIDTGMNRLGLGADALAALAARPDPFEGLGIDLILSHLACADEPAHPKNDAQKARFSEALAMLPKRRASLAASGGTLLGRGFCFDLVRPGIALYGGNPLSRGASPMRDTVRLEAPILQVRRVDIPETVGYGATYEAGSPMRLATAAIGYADGIMRSLSNRGYAIVGETRVPIVGRVSMDLVTLDVSAVPEPLLLPGTSAVFAGAGLPIDDVAGLAGTLAYEFLTGIGPRVERVYLGEANS